MSDLGASDWSQVDASNTAVPPNGWPEGMAPSDVNNAARAQMGGEKRWWARSNSTQTTTGTSTAYVLTYAATEAALYDGEETSFVLHATCGAAPTLNRDALGAKALRKYDFGTNAFIAVAANDYRANQVLRVRYNLSADRYDVIGFSSGAGVFEVLGSNNTWTGTNTFANTVTMSAHAINEAKGANIASASTTDIGAATGNYVHVTGATTITGLGTIQAGTRRVVVFDGILTLTQNGTSLILPTAANITTAAGDIAEFVSEGSGNWKCTNYQRANGAPLGMAVGTLVNRAYIENASSLALAVTIPADDTIPQVTEGTEILSVAITPRSTTNRIRARAVVPLGVPPATSGIACIALFRNGGANAIDSSFPRMVDGLGTYPGVIEFEDVPGSVSTQTYTIRAGGNGFTINLNGDSSGRLGGGSSRATLVLEEIVA